MLCQDIGARFGLPACLSFLVRTESAGLGIADSLALEQIERLHADGALADFVIPVDAMLAGFPRVDLPPAQCRRFLNGAVAAVGTGAAAGFCAGVGIAPEPEASTAVGACACAGVASGSATDIVEGNGAGAGIASRAGAGAGIAPRAGAGAGATAGVGAGIAPDAGADIAAGAGAAARVGAVAGAGIAPDVGADIAAGAGVVSEAAACAASAARGAADQPGAAPAPIGLLARVYIGGAFAGLGELTGELPGVPAGSRQGVPVGSQPGVPAGLAGSGGALFVKMKKMLMEREGI
ncbi:MAG: hypothetical protein LBJ10_00305 [Clostridiales bacterium]|nr:hypothetical protein [Clostridiales bacterium]